jgi:hypothetical protein
MNKKSTVLILLLAVSMISMIPVLSMKLVDAETVPGTTPPKVIDWIMPNGYTDYQTLAWNPEYLKLYTTTQVPTHTTVIIQGKDTYGQNIEAKVEDCFSTHEQPFVFNDTHTTPGKPVAFAQITGILQQNGTDNVRLTIKTQPELFADYLGEFHPGAGAGTGWLPGQYVYGATNAPAIYGAYGTYYLVGNGKVQTPVTHQNFPVEPSNPDPLRIYINWHETDGNLLPNAGTGELDLKSSSGNNWIWIEGLDERGNKLTANMTIPYNISYVDVVAGSGCHTWSSVCKVDGNGPDSYYIFSNPQGERPLFTYTLLIDHMTIHPDCYDILAYPDAIDGKYPGRTNITVALRDKDGNLINCAANSQALHNGAIVVNFATSGGKIQPSSDVWITPLYCTNTTVLIADTNARTVTVTADANVPACAAKYHPVLNLFAWTEMTFDGVNSVGTLWTTIHKMMWGWNSWNGTAYFSTFTGPVPPKPVLPDWLGGPAKDGIKLDGPIYEVMIPLYVGCNLISSPVHPILCNTYMSGYPAGGDGIPMDLLFGKTSATTCIEAVWWYSYNETSHAMQWYHYIPSVDDEASAYFTDGVGYWIYAEKPCTLEISGVFMDNAPFTPPIYTLTANSWNLVGITSLTRISINDYLESINGAAGPVWVYYAWAGVWYRNPPWDLGPGEAFWIFASEESYIAP